MNAPPLNAERSNGHTPTAGLNAPHDKGPPAKAAATMVQPIAKP